MNEPRPTPRLPVMTAADHTGPVIEPVEDTAHGNDGVGGAALKLAIIGPCGSDRTGVAAHTTTLAHHLAQAGHDVTLVSWLHPFHRGRSAGEPEVRREPEVPAFPRTVRALSWARPDTWVRTGRRLRGFDAIIVGDAVPLMVPAHLVMLRAAGGVRGDGDSSGEGAPRSIVIALAALPHRSRPGDFSLMRSLFERVDAVLVHSPEQARMALDLHATRVSVADAIALHSGQEEAEALGLSSPWAHYVGAMEALASPGWQAAEQDFPALSREPSFRARLAAPVREMVRRQRPALAMTRTDLPAWVRPSDVLADGADADDARDWARSFGLPRCPDPIAAWSALGALAAIVRLSDDGHRKAVIFDGSGPRSPLSSWARAIGFAPVELDFTGSRASLAAMDVDSDSFDVITRLHPNGCDSEDVDEALGQASWALRVGGLVALTLPLGPASAAGAVGPADVRAILARAHDLGFVLVGDPDGEITTLMRAASEDPRRGDAAYALVRLTFRRR
jgi:Glycosyltransferase Family 4